jgi:hypothetical protein
VSNDGWLLLADPTGPLTKVSPCLIKGESSSSSFVVVVVMTRIEGCVGWLVGWLERVGAGSPHLARR